jgi:hypothetical protein
MRRLGSLMGHYGTRHRQSVPCDLFPFIPEANDRIGRPSDVRVSCPREPPVQDTDDLAAIYHDSLSVAASQRNAASTSFVVLSSAALVGGDNRRRAPARRQVPVVRQRDERHAVHLRIPGKLVLGEGIDA